MSIFLLPSSLCDEIEKMLNSCWWGHSSSRNKGIYWLSWEKLSMHKLGALCLILKALHLSQIFSYTLQFEQNGKRVNCLLI
jgi:hypothetical protein